MILAGALACNGFQGQLLASAHLDQHDGRVQGGIPHSPWAGIVCRCNVCHRRLWHCAARLIRIMSMSMQSPGWWSLNMPGFKHHCTWPGRTGAAGPGRAHAGILRRV